MMFCVGSLNTPAPIPDSYSCSHSSLKSQMFGLLLAPLYLTSQALTLLADVFCLQFTQNIFASVEFWKVYGEYMCGNNPPGIIHLMIPGF